MNQENITTDEWIKAQFEFEYCDECGGDWYDHDVIPLHLGAYGGPYNFARCKIADNSKWQVRSRE